MPLMLDGAPAVHESVSGGICAPPVKAAVHVTDASPSATSGASQFHPDEADGASSVDLYFTVTTSWVD